MTLELLTPLPCPLPDMPARSKSARELARLRQQTFRARKKSAGAVEVRSLLPKALVEDLELAALFAPRGTKDFIVRTALENHLEVTKEETKKFSQLITKYWGSIMDYQAHAPSLQRPGPNVRIRDRIYTFEEASKLREIRVVIVAFLKGKGVTAPEEAAFVVWQSYKGRK